METLTLLNWAFDVLLGLILLWLVWCTLTSADPFKAIVLFIAFGLLMTLSWVRLDAPDIALAEVALGAGLTGALLLAALARLRSIEENPDFEYHGRHKPALLRCWMPWLAVIFNIMITAGLGYVLLSLPTHNTGLTAAVSQNLESSGVDNPVTAVLLNFRGYDTLLETIVLLVALLGVWSLSDVETRPESPPGHVLETFSRLLLPVLILIICYLLWVGAHAPGGAFQAGSVLAATCVLLVLTRWHLRASYRGLILRMALIAGPGAFLIIAAYALWTEGNLLKFPPEYAGRWILALEIFATLSIGATLTALFFGGRLYNHEEHT